MVNKKQGERGPNEGGNLNRPFDWDRKRAYLEALAQSGRPIVAATVIGVHPETVRAHRRKDDEFSAEYDLAMQRFRESLVSEAVRRGVHGVEEPVFSRGRRAQDVHPDDVDLEAAEQRLIPASVRRFSDSLLQSLLKAHLPEFADKSTVTTVEGQPESDILDELDAEEQEQLERFLAELIAKRKEKSDGEPEADLP